MRDAFWHVRLTEPSSYLYTFSTPWGRKRFLRMPFGISSASEVLQQRNDKNLQQHTQRARHCRRYYYSGERRRRTRRSTTHSDGKGQAKERTIQHFKAPIQDSEGQVESRIKSRTHPNLGRSPSRNRRDLAWVS